MGRRSLSYILVAVIAFGIGASRPAFAESGGLPQLAAQVQTLAAGLAAEIARATKSEGDNAKADDLYRQANDHRVAAQEEWRKAQELWNKRQEALNALHEQQAAAHELRDAGQNAAFADAIKALQADIAKQNVTQERERASAEEQRIEAEALLAAAKAAEQAAAALEKPVVTPPQLADAAASLSAEAQRLHQAESLRAQAIEDRLAADELTIAAAAHGVTSIDQLIGLKCTTADGRAGHVALTVGNDNTIVFTCVANN